jgi:threonine/homoserine/homoserine lactone efflux protein
MTLTPTLLAFFLVAGLLIVTPGPDMALVTRNALAQGRRAALLTGFGVVGGIVVWSTASLFGIAAVLKASAIAFTVVKLAGAAYLLFLGVRTLLSLGTPAGARRHAAPLARFRLTGGSPFQQGLLSNLLNPKIAVFFTSLIPQFVTPGPRATLESALLAAAFATMVLAWLTAYAIFASKARELLQRRSLKRLLDAVSGLVLVGLGLRLAAESR